MREKTAVIPSRVDGEGPPSRGLRHTEKYHASPDENALRFAVALERLRGPSPSARLGMTSVHCQLTYPDQNE